MNYYEEIKDKLIKSEIYDKCKDTSKDKNKVKVYFETGSLLHDAGKEYGKNIIKQYSQKLMADVGKKYNERNLRYMRQFYEMIEKTKWNTMRSKLCWSHYREVITLKNNEEILFYLIEAENNNLTQRQLKELIKFDTYNRLPLETKNNLFKSNQLKVYEIIPNPVLIKSEEKIDKISEYTLKQIILNNLDDFLLQLGSGFTYVGNEYKIKINDTYNYIDLLLYNVKYHCFIVIELKVTELKKEHTGQIQTYMNFIDKNIKSSIDNDTVGIIICKKDNNYVIEYCSDNRIIAREYKII